MHGDTPGGPIRWRMFVPVPIERVFAALATDVGRASFWAESADEDNGTIRFVFAGGYRYEGRILECTPPTRFAVEYFGGVATFTLAAAGPAATDLLLVHEGVGVEEWNEVHAGWLNVLFPLKAQLAYGVDLRNHDPARDWGRGYADQ